MNFTRPPSHSFPILYEFSLPPPLFSFSLFLPSSLSPPLPFLPPSPSQVERSKTIFSQGQTAPDNVWYRVHWPVSGNHSGRESTGLFPKRVSPLSSPFSLISPSPKKFLSCKIYQLSKAPILGLHLRNYISVLLA